jgi:hypothetical protein
MLPIPIALNFLTSSSSIFHFNSATHHHDHQTSQALKSILTGCFSNQTLANQTMSAILDKVSEKNKSSLAHICFYILTVAGNEDVFLMDDDHDNNNNNNFASSSISSAEKRRRASIHFLKCFFPTILSHKEFQRQEESATRLLVEFLDELFDLWFSNISFFGKSLTSSLELKKQMNGFFNDSLHFIAKMLVSVQSDEKNQALKLSCLMMSNQLLRLVSLMFLSFPSSFSTSSSNVGGESSSTSSPSNLAILLENCSVINSSTTLLLSSPSQFRLVISEALETFKKSMIENFEPSFDLVLSESGNSSSSWTLFNSGIDFVVDSVKRESNMTLLSSTCLRAMEAILQASKSIHEQNPSSPVNDVCTECFKKWKDLGSSPELRLLLAFDSIKLGLCCGGDVGIRIFGCEQVENNNSKNKNYSNQNPLLFEALDSLIRFLLLPNKNHEDKFQELVCSLLICFGTPMSFNNNSQLACHLNLDQLEKLLLHYFSSDLVSENNVIRLISLILINKSHIGIPMLFKIASSSSLGNTVEKLDSVLNEMKTKSSEQRQKAVAERVSNELLLFFSRSSDKKITLLQRHLSWWIDKIQDEEIKSLIEQQFHTLIFSEMDDENFDLDQLLKKQGTNKKFVEGIISVFSSSSNSTTTSPMKSIIATPADIFTAFYQSNRDNNSNQNEKHKKIQSNLLQWMMSGKNTTSPQFIIEFMRSGILKSPGIPPIVSLLSSLKLSSRQNEDDDQEFKIFFEESFQEMKKKSSSNFSSDQHSFIAPLICIKIFLSIYDCGGDADDDEKNGTKMKKKMVLEIIKENILNEIIMNQDGNGENDDSSSFQTSFSLKDAWSSFPEMRKIVSEIVTSCLFHSNGMVVILENFQHVSQIILSFFESDREHSNEVLIRFFLLMSCQLILLSTTSKSNTTKSSSKVDLMIPHFKCIEKISLAVAKTCSRILEETFNFENDESAEEETRRTNSQLFNACTDSLSISLLGCLACKYVHSVEFDRCVFEWCKLDRSFYEQNNNHNNDDDVEEEEDVMQNFSIPIAQHSTAKSIILLIQRKLLFFEGEETPFFSNSAQVWNSIGAILNSSLLSSVEITISAEWKKNSSSLSSSRIAAIPQKAHDLCIQLIACISVLTSMCVKQSYDMNFGQCFYDILSLFCNGAATRYPASIQTSPVPRDLFLCFVKMFASIVAVGVEQAAKLKPDASTNIFYLLHEIHVRDCNKAIEILKNHKISEEDEEEEKVLVEFLLQVLEKK